VGGRNTGCNKKMCLAIPMEIKSIDGDMATCEMGGVSVNASVVLVPDAKVGDYAIVHAGLAIEILDEKEAMETLKLFKEITQAFGEENNQ